MRITGDLTDATALAELGARLRRSRLDRNWSQSALAEEAGVSRALVERAEAGDPVRTDGLVRLLRALGLLERLDLLAPEPQPDPIALLDQAGLQRKRARAKPPGSPPPGRQPWPDEQGGR